ncbi:methanol oxidation system protein MoxJ [Methylomagnum ishizawai]|uniref:methanol oxidation system protein MoxJ n=1 Tax=Methylomagnum ishizawai TaxID=1760988 RepID=UPI001C342C66|nr:methanol oxidation system protein MoxJ [Methylomagnum ishizawai]BBL76317.1 amino acid ABC transporter substrate-binding protein [Methylomagnum ishizawai]
MRFKRLALLALLFPLHGTANAAEPLKVCAAENELPYSNQEGKGFENKLAELIADGLGRTVENVWWQDPRYFIRDQLEQGLCEVVIGVDAEDPRLLTSTPYYRSGYVFVYRKEKGLKVEDFDSPYLAKAKQIAFMPDTPAELLLKKINRYYDQFNYLQSLVGFKARRNQYVRYDPEKLVKEVESGNADLAILWGPQAARYVKAAEGKLEMRVIPDHQTRADGEKVPFHYSTAVGVKKDNTALMDGINRVLREKAKDVQALLKAEGIPLLPLDETGSGSHAPHKRKK